MSEPDRRLWCTWHVDKAWRNNVQSKIRCGIELQAKIYKILRMLLEEPDVDTFQRMISRAVHDMLSDPNTVEFGNYFQNYYANQAQY